jgi:GGDEF domain-containing protein
VAERILNDFAQPFSDAEQELYVSPSIGISLFPRDGAAPEDLVKYLVFR